MRAFFFIILLGFLQISACAKLTALFKSYLRDAVDTKLSSLDLADKYFCTINLHRTGQDGEFARQMTDVWLSDQRKKLREKDLNMDEIQFVPYDALTAEQQMAHPFFMRDETTHTWVALYHGEIACFFLLKDDRIASTLLLDMGGENSFIDYCATE